MQKDKFIQCEPDKALFSFDNQTEQLTARVTLKNISQDLVGFKLKSTNPLRYDVQPDALGKIKQGGQTTLVLFMKVDQGQTINTYKDQILVQTIKIQGDKEIAREQFNRRQHPEMQESYLKVAIDAPSRQVMGGLVNTGKYQEHVINVGAPESSVGSAQPIGGQIAQDYVLVEEDTNALQVSPAELHLNMKQGQGQARAVLRLVNESRHAIAFKVKSTNAQRYNIHPAAIGVVNHYSSQELIISISGEARFPEEVLSQYKHVVVYLLASNIFLNNTLSWITVHVIVVGEC
eukprot:TRINITY_DN3851_c0_g2_i1.p2 TRINITY_DN3851_c0_g2~~TRINITY_DN3851_c0_g2_i1.p2  ORF type:complete len:290 (+),score=22.28 TRINITY_DN3851_c0_g2_i1:190-1059(+)